MPLVIPPTRNHRQLAAWVNSQRLVDDKRRLVRAVVESWTSSTDSKIAGTRFRRVGKGRKGLRLRIQLVDVPTIHGDWFVIFDHISSDTYRCHTEARDWIQKHLRHKKAS